MNRGGSDFKLGGGGLGGSRNSDLDRQIGLLKSCECIKESEVRDLCNMARDILLNESNIQNISSPITVSTNTISFSKFISRIDLRRYSWSVLRFNGTIQGRRRLPQDELHFHG